MESSGLAMGMSNMRGGWSSWGMSRWRGSAPGGGRRVAPAGPADRRTAGEVNEVGARGCMAVAPRSRGRGGADVDASLSGVRSPPRASPSRRSTCRFVRTVPPADDIRRLWMPPGSGVGVLAMAVSECSRGPISCCHGVPFHVAATKSVNGTGDRLTGRR